MTFSRPHACGMEGEEVDAHLQDSHRVKSCFDFCLRIRKSVKRIRLRCQEDEADTICNVAYVCMQVSSTVEVRETDGRK